MNTLKQLWINISMEFNKLPSPIKAIFFVAFNATLALLSKDVLKLGAGNEYVAIWTGAISNILAYLALYYGNKAGK